MDNLMIFQDQARLNLEKLTSIISDGDIQYTVMIADKISKLGFLITEIQKFIDYNDNLFTNN